MQISCPQCSAQYKVDETRIPPQGVSINCPRCKHTFVAQAPAVGAAPTAAPAAPAAAPAAPTSVLLPGAGVPLPGAASAGVPLPGARPSRPVTSEGVPLPGAARPFAGVPLPGASSVALPGGGVPLPGASRTVASSAGVPLPGASQATMSMADAFGKAPVADPAAGANSRALSMNDIFGDVSASAGVEQNTSPFHGTNSVKVDVGGDVLGSIDRADGAADRPPEFQIRKRSGRVLGPFAAEAVVAMFQRGELLGSEEASTDGVTWRPLAQINAFASTIQSAMANALSGLEDLPMLKGSGMDDLPVPHTPGNENLPTPKKRGASGNLQHTAQTAPDPFANPAAAAAAVDASPATARSKAPLIAAAAVAVALVGIGVGMNFVTDYGYFGSKLLMPQAPPVDVVLKPPAAVVDALPPAPPAVQAQYADLLRPDTYLSYRQGADQAARAVDALKATSPFPEAGKVAAAQLVRFLSYLITVEELASFVPQLQGALPLVPGDDVTKALGDATLAFSQRQWDKGLATLAPFKDPARGLDAIARSEVLTFTGLGLAGKGDAAAATASFDEAHTANATNALALVLRAQQMAQGPAPKDALPLFDQVLALSPGHPRATLNKARLLINDVATAEAGAALLTDVSEGKVAQSAAPAQSAQAFVARAQLAIAAQQAPAAKVLLNSAVALVPSNKTVRLAAAQAALRVRDIDFAKECAAALQKADAADVDGAILLARVKLAAGDTLSAYTDMQAVLKKQPDHPAANYWMGVAANGLAKPDEARAQFDKAAKLDPKAAAPIVDLIEDAVDNGKLDVALKRAAEAEPVVDADGRYALQVAKARVLIRTRAFADADAALSAAQASRPNEMGARLTTVALRIAQKRLADAQQAIADAKAVDANDALLTMSTGDLLAAQKDFKGALQSYQTALAAAPTVAQIYLHAAAVALELKESARAKGFVDTAAQLRPGTVDLMVMQASLLRDTDAKGAAQLMQQAIAKSPLEPGINYQLGAQLQAAGLPVEAVGYLKAAVQQDPQFIDALLLLGVVDRELGRVIEGKEALNTCVKLAPNNVSCWVALADTLAASGNDAGSLKAYESAVAADPNDPSITCAMGETLVVRMGEVTKNLKRGIAMLEKCVKLNATHPSAWKNLGNAYKTIFKKKDAARCYRQHLLVNPKDDEAKQVREFLAEVGG